MESARITILTGQYGSGKTEIAINYTQYLAGMHTPVLLVDLDVVNPYFRSREKANFLAEKGIEVIYPRNISNADLPIIPAQLKKLTTSFENYGVIDVGGDEEGARVLGSLAPDLTDKDYEMCLVVNNFRTFTRNATGIIETKKRIESRSRMAINSLVCNPNLGQETSPADIEKGYRVIKEAAARLELPIKFVTVRQDLLPLNRPGFRVEEEILPLEINLALPWER